jgi:hypothetical protein
MQEGYRWLLPLHGGNFSRERAQELVRYWPNETAATAPLPAQGHQPAPVGVAAAKSGRQGHGAKTAAPESPHDTAAAGLGLSPGKPGKVGDTSRHVQSKGPTGGPAAAGSSGGEL